MFKNLMQFWRGKDFLGQVLEEFRNMLDDSRTMFKGVCKKLIYAEDIGNLKDKIYHLDKKINEVERDIRRRVIEHLAVQPSIDVPVSLILMSVVKDAERLGDYCKNLYEVSELLDKPIDEAKYRELFGDTDKAVLDLFAETREAFVQSDENKAAELWERERKIVKGCDAILEKVAKSSLSVNEAVCFALMARYFKRITAHLANIGTSVIVPVSDLDYYDEKRAEA
ncbi:MAG: PhoU domain-containing protein [Candidatus Omnitrophota bacterium]